MNGIKVESLPAELAARLREQFPGAAEVAEDLCTVRCEGLFIGDRFGGTASLGTNPTSEKLVEDIRAWRAA